MNSYYPMALLLARPDQITLHAHEARSALPNAPVVREKEQLDQRWRAVRGYIASSLHRLAWAIES